MQIGIVRGINTVLGALDGVVTAVGSVIGIDIHVPKLSEISLPRLATGNVAYEETLAIFGEYSGASYNPEITAPRNTIKEVVEEALANKGSSGQQHLSIYYLGKEIFDDTIDYINDKTRRTGKCVIKVGN